MSSDDLFEHLAELLGSVSEELEPSFSMASVLDLPARERHLMRHVMRRSMPATLCELAEELNWSVADVRSAVDALVDHGALDFDGHTVSVAAMTVNRRGTPGGMWNRLSGL